jgi:hypothetical protein
LTGDVVEDFSEALRLLDDKNLVWSEDFESIRKNLALLMAKAWEMEYAGLEPELGDLALNLIRGQNARESKATDSD